jgi:hypothetical protein
MAPIDEWLNVWLSAADLAKSGECRLPNAGSGRTFWLAHLN